MVTDLELQLERDNPPLPPRGGYDGGETEKTCGPAKGIIKAVVFSLPFWILAGLFIWEYV